MRDFNHFLQHVHQSKILCQAMHCLRGIYSSATISFISPCCHLAVVVLHNLVPWYLFISNISFISPCCHLTVVVLLHNLVSMVSIHQQLSLSSHPAVVSLLLSCITS